MSPNELNDLFTQTVGRLSEPDSLHGLFHEHNDGDPLPSAPALAEIVDLCRAILFPGFYGKSTLNSKTLPYHIGVSLDRLNHLLTQQVLAGLCFQNTEKVPACQLAEKSQTIATEFIKRLPELRNILATDVEAAYNGDPAAESYSEIISCYPVIKAISSHRIAHELLLLGVPLIPRIISEMAHSETGIDIHPGAQIGHHFTIDHGTGVVIGHEMSHGFDDQGRQFDKDGNFRDWWAEGDADKYNERAQVIKDFFSAIKVLPDLNANGDLCCGENLGDHGGLKFAYAAFKNATKDNPLPVKEGFTPEQRFFLAYAGVWGQNITEAEIRRLTTIDPHSLGEWRVNGALPLLDAWYEAFGITEADPLFVPEEKRVKIW